MNPLIDFLKLNKDDWEDKLTKPPYSLKLDKKDNLVLFKYNQIESNFSDPIVKVSRGIIVDMETLEVVCYPFDKFFNYGEQYAAELDWSSVKGISKIDGSLLKLWYDEKRDWWRLSTNGKIDAYEVNLDNNIKYLTFGDLAEQAFENIGLNDDYSRFDKDYTYMFELVSPYNKVVVQYDDVKLYHIGTRNNKTGEEIVSYVNIPHPADFPFKIFSIEDVIDTVKKLDFKHEGFVLVDKYFRRLKVKSPEYVIAHHPVEQWSN